MMCLLSNNLPFKFWVWGAGSYFVELMLGVGTGNHFSGLPLGGGSRALNSLGVGTAGRHWEVNQRDRGLPLGAGQAGLMNDVHSI